VKGYAKHPNSPGFFCCSEEKQSGICSSSTEAINACYKEVFHSNAKFPSPPVMGFDNSNVVKQLFSDVIFCPYTFRDEYKSIFQCNSNNVRSVYVQKLEHEKSTVQVFINNAFAKLYSTSDPNKVWLNIDRFSNYTEKVLFELEYSYTQLALNKAHNAQIDNATLQVLYKSESFQPRSENFTDIFWQVFRDALE
ncbi:15342_t:CDS:2, partial [Funneliformis geosporum]